ALHRLDSHVWQRCAGSSAGWDGEGAERARPMERDRGQEVCRGRARAHGAGCRARQLHLRHRGREDGERISSEGGLHPRRLEAASATKLCPLGDHKGGLP
ncbi:unnamed protein product, partial [Ectocarpus fasciculatus]